MLTFRTTQKCAKAGKLTTLQGRLRSACHDLTNWKRLKPLEGEDRDLFSVQPRFLYADIVRRGTWSPCPHCRREIRGTMVGAGFLFGRKGKRFVCIQMGISRGVK